MGRASVVAYLRALTAKQFAELFYESVEGRHAWPGEERLCEVHFILSFVTRELDESEPDKSWQLYVVCPVPNVEWGDDAPLCQCGSHCGHNTVSWAKQSACPICGGQVHGG